jgi:hypothetical protein
MVDFDKRILNDRRKKPTPALSWYTFLGRRRGFRRKWDQEKGGHVDRYSPKLFLFLVLILGLNILDVLFTMIILVIRGGSLIPLSGLL